jgi:Ca2+-binding RTX toxin-like protein
LEELEARLAPAVFIVNTTADTVAWMISGFGDLLLGGNGNDNRDGGDGDDRLFGDDGDDFLGGGAGTDTIDGGLGTDVASNGEIVSNAP